MELWTHEAGAGWRSKPNLLTKLLESAESVTGSQSALKFEVKMGFARWAMVNPFDFEAWPFIIQQDNAVACRHLGAVPGIPLVNAGRRIGVVQTSRVHIAVNVKRPLAIQRVRNCSHFRAF